MNYATINALSKARVFRAAAAIAPVYEQVSMAIIAEVDNGRDPNASAPDERDRLRNLADEAEALQAALVLGLACTSKGNNIHHANLDSTPRSRDRTGAIATLYQGRES